MINYNVLKYVLFQIFWMLEQSKIKSLSMDDVNGFLSYLLWNYYTLQIYIL